MTDNKEREAFEYWASDDGTNAKAVERSGDGYILAQIQTYWMAWKARAAIAAAPATEPVFWYRQRSDGGYEGPIHNASIEDVRKRSGAWTPLFTGAAPVAAQASEPVLYQCRTRPDWRPDGWTKWEDCTPESAGDYERTPLLHDWHYEVRRLYTDQDSAESSTSVTWIAEAVRNAALDALVQCVQHMTWYTSAGEIAYGKACDAMRALKSAPPQPAEQPSAARGEVVVTWDKDRTRILAVTRQDDEGQILSVIAEAPSEAKAAPVAQWIPVSERLPETGDEVWLSTKHDVVIVGMKGWRQGWDPDYWELGVAGELSMGEVTHWMPLVVPSAPQPTPGAETEGE